MWQASDALWRRSGLALLTLMLLGWSSLAAAQTPPAPLLVVPLEGVVAAPGFERARRALNDARASGATALLLEVDGRATVTAEALRFARDIVAAPLPVVVHLSGDTGALGAILAAAAHVVAMTPEALIGHSRPLVGPAQPASTARETSALLAEWVSMRQRDASWVDDVVYRGRRVGPATLPAITDVVADDRAALLAQLEGRRVMLANGSERRLTTLTAPLVTPEPTIGELLGQLLTQPAVLVWLWLAAVIAAALEFATPGVGVFAATAVLAALACAWGLNALPFHGWALALVLVGTGLIVLDGALASHGLLAAAGSLVAALGAFALFDDTRAPGVLIDGFALAPVLIAGGLSSIAGLVLGWQSRRSRHADDPLIGHYADVRQACAPEGLVYVAGALWRARLATGQALPGDIVCVIGRQQLTLLVRPLDDAEAAALRRGEP